MYCAYAEKHVLVKKGFTNGQKTGLALRVWIEKTGHLVEIHWLSNKENVPRAAVSKEGHADSVQGHERTHDLISLKKVQL